MERTVGCSAQRRVGVAAANGFYAELNGGGARCTCRGKRDRRTLGAEHLGQVIGYRAEQKTPVICGVSSAAADAQYGVVIEIGFRNRAPKFLALRPFDLDRGNGKKQRPGKITFAADSGFTDGFFR